MTEHKGYLCDVCQKTGRRYMEEGAKSDRLLQLLARFLSAASEVEEALDGMPHLIADILMEAIDQRLILDYVAFGHSLAPHSKERQEVQVDIKRLKSIFAAL